MQYKNYISMQLELKQFTFKMDHFYRVVNLNDRNTVKCKMQYKWTRTQANKSLKITISFIEWEI